MFYLLNNRYYMIYKENNVCTLSGELDNDKIMRHKNCLARYNKLIPVYKILLNSSFW